jgi:hypothetical protein
MLNENDLAAWYQRLNFSEPARTVIGRVRCSDPAHRVGGGRSNVSGFYPSRKMGVTIQFESHRVELAAIFEMENDSAPPSPKPSPGTSDCCRGPVIVGIQRATCRKGPCG